MLEPQTKPIDETRLKNIMRNNPQIQELGTNLACVVALPTILSPKKSKKEGSGSEYDPEGEEDLIEGGMPVEITFQ